MISRQPQTGASRDARVLGGISNRALAHLLLLGVVAVWGSTFALVKAALQDASPLLFNLLRMAIGAAALWAVHHRRLRRLPRRTYLAGMVAGLLLAAGYQFQTLGLARTTPVKSAFITGLVVVFVPILASLPRLRPPGSPRPRWPTAVGALLAFSGLLLLTTPSGLALGNLATNLGAGDLLTLLCAIAFAGHLLALAHLAPAIRAGQLATLQVTFAAVFMLLTLPLSGALHLQLSPRLLAALAVTSLFATAAAFTIQSWAQQHIPPANTAILLTLEPVFALALSLIFLGDRMSLRSALGAALILCGIATIELLALPAPIAIEPS